MEKVKFDEQKKTIWKVEVKKSAMGYQIWSEKGSYTRWDSNNKKHTGSGKKKTMKTTYIRQEDKCINQASMDFNAFLC